MTEKEKKPKTIDANELTDEDLENVQGGRLDSDGKRVKPSKNEFYQPADKFVTSKEGDPPRRKE